MGVSLIILLVGLITVTVTVLLYKYTKLKRLHLGISGLSGIVITGLGGYLFVNSFSTDSVLKRVTKQLSKMEAIESQLLEEGASAATILYHKSLLKEVGVLDKLEIEALKDGDEELAEDILEELTTAIGEKALEVTSLEGVLDRKREDMIAAKRKKDEAKRLKAENKRRQAETGKPKNIKKDNVRRRKRKEVRKQVGVKKTKKPRARRTGKSRSRSKRRRRGGGSPFYESDQGFDGYLTTTDDESCDTDSDSDSDGGVDVFKLLGL